MHHGENQNGARFHDKLVVKANRLGRIFEAGDLLNIFIRGIDDSIIQAVYQRYSDQATNFRQTNNTTTELQLKEVLRNL